MEFQLPEFKVDYLEFYYVCARIENPSQELLEWVQGLKDEEDHTEASFEIDDGRAWVLAIANIVDQGEEGEDQESYVHFHVSAARESFFSSEKIKEPPSHTVEQVSAFCQRFDEAALDLVRVRARFVLPEAELPERSVGILLGTKATVGDQKVVIDNFKAKFEDADQPHIRMEWSTRSKDDNRVLVISSRYEDSLFSGSFVRDQESKLGEVLTNLVLER